MFAGNHTANMNVAIPDICLVPMPAPTPTPLVNINTTSTHIPTVPNVLFGPSPAQNLASTTPISTGSEPAPPGGAVSHMMDGSSRPLVGSMKTFVGPMPSTRVTTLNGQNGTIPNSVGVQMTPGQIRVLLPT